MVCLRGYKALPDLRCQVRHSASVLSSLYAQTNILLLCFASKTLPLLQLACHPSSELNLALAETTGSKSLLHSGTDTVQWCEACC